MKSAQGYRRSCRFKIFLSLALNFLCWSRTILAISVGSNLGNIPVKSKSHWPKGLGENSI